MNGRPAASASVRIIGMPSALDGSTTTRDARISGLISRGSTGLSIDILSSRGGS